MTDLPSGTVTFLFTDIEGSTRLLQQLGEHYAPLLATHDRILREACESHNGRVVDNRGDGLFVAFASAADALEAVVQSQRALASQPWGNGVSVRVRMGLHTGEPQIGPSGYLGLDVHRAARIAAAGYGEQVLLSQTSVNLLEGKLPEGVALRDLGDHRLKDLRQPKHLYQLVITGLPSEFPALKSLEVSGNNLPLQLTSFIGREMEIAEVTQAIREHRLVTLTGPGGSGKTRLAMQVGAGMVDHFRNGVFIAALAPISDPALVPSTIAQALGVTEAAGRPIIDSLKDYLQSKTLLLLLDNFEQVIGAAPLVAELLAACSELKILVTSRESLRISGEQEYPVPPLALPTPTQQPSLESLSHYPAVELFVQRARAVKPDFRITEETLAAVTEICRRLDGLPLAIELAAARAKLFPPRTMLARLENRLEFLKSGSRDLPARQQTLRNAIAWSYDLLNEDEKELFRQVSVFVGGCTQEAIEAVTGSDGTGALWEQLGSLLDKSLLREAEGISGEPRFLMLETLRDYGLEQLEASGAGYTIRRRHADFFLAFAEQAESTRERTEQVQWMNQMEEEHDNLRAALEWSRTAEGAEELCLRLAGTLALFWEVRGYFSEGRSRLSAVLSTQAAQGRTLARGRLLGRAAELAYRQSDYPATISFARESLVICREWGDGQGSASALLKLGNAATEGGDYASATKYLEEALATWRELGDRHGTARALISFGWDALRSGEYELARDRLEEALALSRQLADTRSIGFELSGLGEVAMRQGDYVRAKRLLEESLALRRQLGNKWGVGVSLGTLGWVAMREGDWNRALDRLEESLEVREEISDKGGSAWCLERLAEIALAQQQAEKAVRLFGAAASLRESIGSVIDPADQAQHESRLSSLREELGSERFVGAWNNGHALSLKEAIAQALEDRER